MSRRVTSDRMERVWGADGGATMVEFALAAAFLILLIGGIVDLGLGMHNYMLLEQVTQEAVREASVRLNSAGMPMTLAGRCQSIHRYLECDAEERLIQHLGGDADPDWTITWVYGFGAQPDAVEISSRSRLRCYFLCSMFPNGFPLSAASALTVEGNVRLEAPPLDPNDRRQQCPAVPAPRCT